jgi:Protein of unknown function (DUF3789)
MGAKMVFFILGLTLGTFLGVCLIALLIKSKEANEKVFGFLEEKDGVPQESTPVISRSTF